MAHIRRIHCYIRTLTGLGVPYGVFHDARHVMDKFLILCWEVKNRLLRFFALAAVSNDVFVQEPRTQHGGMTLSNVALRERSASRDQ